MKEEHSIIINKLMTYLDQNPSQRFGQALFNLGINEFEPNKEYQLRDIYSDADSEIIQRMDQRLERFNSQKKQ